MIRDIVRNEFGQIVSYEITSSNDEYGKIYLEPVISKFDKKSFDEIYPNKIDLELPIDEVILSFDFTQTTFPSYKFNRNRTLTVLEARRLLSGSSIPRERSTISQRPRPRQ